MMGDMLPPNDPLELSRRATDAWHQGNVAAAIELLERAVRIAPQVAELHNNLGVMLQAAGRIREAGEHFRTAATLKPAYLDALNNLAAHAAEQGNFAEAIECARRVLAIDSNRADVWNNLGNALMRQGEIDNAIAAYRRSIDLDPNRSEARSNLLLTLHYSPRQTPQQIFQEHLRLAPAAHPAAHDNPRDPERKLRVGYVSADFFAHSVGYFIESLIEKHDRERYEIFCYSDVPRPDEVTGRLKSRASVWRRTVALADDDVCKLIRADRIDILIDLAGHTAYNRLAVFAQKPAPVQVTYLGYPDTTGMSSIDWRLTDSLADPSGEADSFSVEKLFRIDPCAWCYRPYENAPSIPRRDPARPIMFGSFNALPKINDDVVETWAKIVSAVEGSRLLIKAGGLSSSDAADRLRRAFAAQGVSGDRLELSGQVIDTIQHLAMYHRVDIALDTFPYNGTTTTCEAMWMGVPVVTLAGPTHAGRVGVSLLNSVGLNEIIGRSPRKYIEEAIGLARNRPRLASLHENLRIRMQQSPLLDAEAHTRRIELALRSMWRAWCEPLR